MKNYINQSICLFVCVIFLMTTPGSVFAEISEAENCENISSEDLLLPRLETDNGQKLQEIKILDEKTTEDGNVITKAQLPFIQEGNLFSSFQENDIETSGLLKGTKEQVKADILRAINNLESSIALSKYRIPTAEYNEVFEWYHELIDNQPQLFYVNSETSVLRNGEIVLELRITYGYSIDEIINMRLSYENSIQEIASHVKNGMTSTEKVLAVHDVLCQSVEYDYENLNKGTVPKEDHTAYSALVKGVSVCDGYSLAFLDLMKRIGVETKCVTSLSMNHAWNLVKIDNDWYHIDTTWDDQEDYVSHIFFIKSDSYFTNLGNLSHTLDYYIPSPAATNSKYDNFLKRSATMLYDEKSKQWIYKENGSIYGSKIDGSDKKLLIQNSTDPIKSFAIWKNVIFFQRQSNNVDVKNKIYFSNTDVKKEGVFDQLSLNEKTSYSGLRVKNSTLYYYYKDPEIDNYFHHETRSINILGKNDELGITTVLYRTHIQDIGWQAWKNQGGTSGTLGQNKRLEGIEIKLNNENADLNVEYSAHIQNIGWQPYKSNGEMSGTFGKGLQLEAIKINLTGADASKFDIYYQVHAQNIGWLDWTKNGSQAGTVGFGYRLEAVRIVVVPKGAVAPGSVNRPFVQV